MCLQKLTSFVMHALWMLLLPTLFPFILAQILVRVAPITDWSHIVLVCLCAHATNSESLIANG